MNQQFTCQNQYTGYRGEVLQWIPIAGHGQTLKAALFALHHADSHGLDPANYDARELTDKARVLSGGLLDSPGFTKKNARSPEPTSAAQAEHIYRFNQHLTQAVACYLQQVRVGQLEPEMVHKNTMLRPHYWKAMPALLDAWRNDRVPSLLVESPPTDTNYQRLRGALKRYRQAASQSDPAQQPSLAWRLARIELALERIRWSPRNQGERRITVNIPEYRLRVSEGTKTLLSSKVVVGTPGRSATPFYSGRLSRVVLNPTWYVPNSIARNDLLPKIKRNPAFLADNKMVVVDHNGDAHTRLSPQLARSIHQNRARIEQKPGVKNALGRVKFILPNPRAIFIHDTDTPEHFAETQRAFSSGCVRVEDATELAEFIFREHSSLSEKRIGKVLTSQKTHSVKPVRPMLVVLTYRTVVVNRAGALSFLPDIYGWDQPAIEMVPRWAAAYGKYNNNRPEKIARLKI
ncbi:MAG: L,D-transpeptidase family protein [Burkholderiaceae bacterium]